MLSAQRQESTAYFPSEWSELPVLATSLSPRPPVAALPPTVHIKGGVGSLGDMSDSRSGESQAHRVKQISRGIAQTATSYAAPVTSSQPKFLRMPLSQASLKSGRQSLRFSLSCRNFRRA
jgi:hypothetical protein